ncbi:Spore coat protein gerQ [Bhargavaea cecembensis DSE10]|uniref:Spore coat protein gerQ n=1 Tax=Bhargavaea cecembensis DSE10 TaxID=1235279 RepID=M7P1U1_9BACL|nr:spore coat protein GerQ [Bhargavaea cecembensis]EMR07840.1 Spore coat protein gerQ [Bhargavaea cecembensis DSE10]
MVQYYWNPNYRPMPMQPVQQPQQQVIPPQVTLPTASRQPQGEESYIENILRMNRGQPGTFHFSFEHGDRQTTTKSVRGFVEAAGRDHVILREARTDHRFLFPMIYFDYAEFDEELNYFDQTPR